MSMRRQTNQQTITIVCFDYHRIPGSLLQLLQLYRFSCVHKFEQFIF